MLQMKHASGFLPRTVYSREVPKKTYLYNRYERHDHFAMPEHHKKRRFLNLPKYPGGSKAFREFISATLHYPGPALNAGVEGTVVVEFDILDNGVVQNPRVLKGIGHGCDEEAVRVVGMLRYEKVKNRGVRVRMTTKTNINFRLPPGVRISYSVEKKEGAATRAENEKDRPAQVTYDYTITL